VSDIPAIASNGCAASDMTHVGMPERVRADTCILVVKVLIASLLGTLTHVQVAQSNGLAASRDIERKGELTR
jgi:hypothetical protein